MKLKLNKILSAILVVVGSMSFTISANSATTQANGNAPLTAENIAKIEKSAKKLSGAELFKKASVEFEQAFNGGGNYDLSYIYAKQGAAKKNADAQLLLSLMYEMGYGVAMDTDVAEEWRTKAANNGSLDAKGIIAIMGIAQDLDQENVAKFKPYAEEAFKTGSIFGKAAMAYVLHDGYGGEEPEPVEGQKLLLEAMSQPMEKLNFFERIYLNDIRELVLQIE